MSDLPEITIDTVLATSCRAMIVELQTAYIKLLAGQTRIKVRHNERWSEYHPASAPALLKFINLLFDQCPDTVGLMDLRPSRGRPMFLRIT